jgi:hypothetical protein
MWLLKKSTNKKGIPQFIDSYLGSRHHKEWRLLLTARIVAGLALLRHAFEAAIPVRHTATFSTLPVFSVA